MRVGVITESERFALHGLKHRDITESKDKASGGHRTERCGSDTTTRHPSWNQPNSLRFQEGFQEATKRAHKAPFKLLMQLVGRDGFEPSTKRLKVFCSTN